MPVFMGPPAPVDPKPQMMGPPVNTSTKPKSPAKPAQPKKKTGAGMAANNNFAGPSAQPPNLVGPSPSVANKVGPMVGPAPMMNAPSTGPIAIPHPSFMGGHGIVAPGGLVGNRAMPVPVQHGPVFGGHAMNGPVNPRLPGLWGRYGMMFGR